MEREIRLGNYLKINWSNELRKIDQLDIRDIAEGRINGGVSPIYITHEWLLKFGFEKCVNGYWSSDEFLNVKIYDKSIEVYISGSDTNLAHADFSYIHQLQNIYFCLTNKELQLSE